MVTKPACPYPFSEIGFVLAKKLMVTKQVDIESDNFESFVLAKKLMVTKQTKHTDYY